MFKCEICGKEYKTVAERAACEAACLKKLEADQAAKKAEEAKAREAKMKQEIYDSIDKTEKLVNGYEEEFGSVPNLAKIFYDLRSPKGVEDQIKLRPSLWQWLLNL